MSDVPSLTFVDPLEADYVFRVVLWAAPGEGKTVGATSAPGPILALSADRPGAYRFARRHHPDKVIRETRYQNTRQLDEILAYLRAEGDVQTVILDPFTGIYDRIVDQAPRRADGEPNYQAVNKRILDFLYALRDLDVHVVIVAHEKLNDGKKGDGKLYPALGGPSLINKILAESDIVARVYREHGEGENPTRYMAQLAPTGNLVCKDSTSAGLGETRELDLSEWFAAALPANEDLPWTDEDGEGSEEPVEAQQELTA